MTINHGKLKGGVVKFVDARVEEMVIRQRGKTTVAVGAKTKPLMNAQEKYFLLELKFVKEGIMYESSCEKPPWN